MHEPVIVLSSVYIVWILPYHWISWIPPYHWICWIPPYHWISLILPFHWISWIPPYHWICWIPPYHWISLILPYQWISLIPPYHWISNFFFYYIIIFNWIRNSRVYYAKKHTYSYEVMLLKCLTRIQSQAHLIIQIIFIELHEDDNIFF